MGVRFLGWGRGRSSAGCVKVRVAAGEKAEQRALNVACEQEKSAWVVAELRNGCEQECVAALHANVSA